MYVHTLHFTSRNELSWAFHYLLSAPFVDDCLTVPETLSIRFVAGPERAATLIERIYLRGCLTWCVRSSLFPQPGQGV